MRISEERFLIAVIAIGLGIGVLQPPSRAEAQQLEAWLNNGLVGAELRVGGNLGSGLNLLTGLNVGIQRWETSTSYVSDDRSELVDNSDGGLSVGVPLEVRIDLGEPEVEEFTAVVRPGIGVRAFFSDNFSFGANASLLFGAHYRVAEGVRIGIEVGPTATFAQSEQSGQTTYEDGFMESWHERSRTLSLGIKGRLGLIFDLDA